MKLEPVGSFRDSWVWPGLGPELKSDILMKAGKLFRTGYRLIVQFCM